MKNIKAFENFPGSGTRKLNRNWLEPLDNISKFCFYLEDMEMMDEIYGILMEKCQTISRYFNWNEDASCRYVYCDDQVWEIGPKRNKKVIEFDEMVKMIKDLEE
jgi:penicillin-binding protein-related factor A (putative recombinase)